MAVLVATKGFLIPTATSVAWEALSDLQYWKRWDRLIHQVELLESPKAGALGRISFKPKPNTSRLLKFTEVELGRRIQWEFDAALGAWIQQCAIIENAEGSIVTFETRFRGSCESLVGRVAEKRVASRLEDCGLRFASVCKDITTSRQVQQQISQDLARVA